MLQCAQLVISLCIQTLALRCVRSVSLQSGRNRIFIFISTSVLSEMHVVKKNPRRPGCTCDEGNYRDCEVPQVVPAPHTMTNMAEVIEVVPLERA